MGIMLIDMKIFKFLEKPWFGMRWEGGEYLVGEDWWFCERVEAAKFDIFIDQGLSNEVRHWSGETGFGHEMCLAELIMKEELEDAPRKRSAVQGEDEFGWDEDTTGVQGEGGRGGEVVAQKEKEEERQ